MVLMASAESSQRIQMDSGCLCTLRSYPRRLGTNGTAGQIGVLLILVLWTKDPRCFARRVMFALSTLTIIYVFKF